MANIYRLRKQKVLYNYILKQTRKGKLPLRVCFLSFDRIMQIVCYGVRRSVALIVAVN